MYDINTKNVKKGKRLYYLFLALGLLFLVVMCFIVGLNITKQKSLDSKTMSTSVEIKTSLNDDGDTMYSPVYYYVVRGKQYVCSSNMSSSINPGTENKTVYYDSNNPSKCMTDYSKSSNYIIFAFMIIPVIFIAVGVVNIKKVNKRLEQIEELNLRGKLVKNLPYHLENSNITVNNVPIQLPVVEYTLSSGTTVTLRGDPRLDKKYADADGMVDLVIDESNPENYFIDFEINRLNGNVSSDYYTAPNTEVTQQTVQSPNEINNDMNQNNNQF